MVHKNPLQKKWQMQKDNAKRRGILFQLTFEQWMKIWTKSGRIKKMGRRHGQYVMSRLGDAGAYRIGNVRIITCNNNSRNFSKEVRRRMSDAAKSREPISTFTRQKMSAAQTGRRHSKETKLKISTSNKGRVGGFVGKTHSEETKALMRRSWRNQYGREN